MAGVNELVPDGARAVTVGNAVVGYVVGDKRPSQSERRERRSPEASMRLAEVEKVLTHLFGGPVDTDDAEHLSPIMASAVAWKIAARAATGTPTLTRQVAEHLRRWFPTLTVSQRGALAFKAASERVYLPADAVAQALGVTMALRQQLGLTTIGACDVSKRKRKAIVRKEKRARDRDTQETRRRAAGAVPRADYVERSVAQIARLAGVSRKTIYAWKAAGVLEAKLAERTGNRCVVPTHTKYIGRDGPVTFGPIERDIAPSRGAPVIADTALQKSVERRDGRPSGAAVTPRSTDPASYFPSIIARLIEKTTVPAKGVRAGIDRLTSPTATALSPLRQSRQGGSAEGRPASTSTSPRETCAHSERIAK